MGAYLQGCVLACDLNHKGNSRYESCEISRGVDMRGRLEVPYRSEMVI
jgi:hypothetical protein